MVSIPSLAVLHIEFVTYICFFVSMWRTYGFWGGFGALEKYFYNAIYHTVFVLLGALNPALLSCACLYSYSDVKRRNFKTRPNSSPWWNEMNLTLVTFSVLLQVCHHPNCQELNGKSPMHLCESCDSRCHLDESDSMHFDRHPRFDVQPQGK